MSRYNESPPEPAEFTYNVELTILVKGVKATSQEEAEALAKSMAVDGELVAADAYLEEEDQDFDDLED